MSDIQAFAINRIHRRIDGKTDAVPSKKVFPCSKDDFARLVKLGAVRKATEDEIAAAKAESAKLDGTAALAKQSEVESSTTTKAEKAAAARAEKAAERAAADEAAKAEAAEAAKAEAAKAEAAKAADDEQKAAQKTTEQQPADDTDI